ncbi:MAG: magnesium transporter MgtE N-terminal domain-containing protein [Gemmataceae bacterium]
MAGEREALRDWHRLFGLLLTDFFTDSPFSVEIETDLSMQQQFLDIVVVRQRPERFAGRLPDGLEDLAEHNLITFKSHREALDDWAVRELVSHYVAYRKLVSPSPSELLPAADFRLYAVCARFPHNLASQVPWQQRQVGVYDCHWGLDVVRVLVAGQLPREAHNAPLHLFSASPELVDFASAAYQPQSDYTSSLLGQLFAGLRKEGFTMSYTMADFRRDYVKEHFADLAPEEQVAVWRSLPARKRAAMFQSMPWGEQMALLQSLPPESQAVVLQSLPLEKQAAVLQSLPPESQAVVLQSLPPEKQAAVLQSLPPETRLAGLSVEQIQQYLDQLTAGRSAAPRKPRRKK